MPAFYPRTMPAQMPLTPPEFVPQQRSAGCDGVQFQQAVFVPTPGMGIGMGVVNREERSYSTIQRYNQPPSAAVPQQHTAFALPSSYVNVPHSTNRYFEPVGFPVLPPMRAQTHAADNLPEALHQHQREQQQQQQQAKEDKSVVGGVSAKLDYDMERMTDFVAEMAQGIVQHGLGVAPQFRKWISQVLSATRLPSATILLSLHYLSVRMTMLSKGGPFKAEEGQIYRLLTIALVLGSKFLDDNTFINRSWSEVSGITVAEINSLELDWLVDIRFSLHLDYAGQQSFNTWHAHWQQYDSQAVANAARLSQANALESNVRRQRSVNKPFAAPSFDQLYHMSAMQEVEAKLHKAQYSNPPYPQYDAWMASRSGDQGSPVSAPHTGPPTPDYYNGPSGWPVPEGYSRRTMFGFPPVMQQSSTRPAAYVPSVVHQTYSQHAWGGHGPGCHCVYCQPQVAPYLVTPVYGLQPVAG